MGSSPSPPDPYATAKAQTQSNEQTAQYQQGLNMVNQVTPYGSLTYDTTPGANGQPPTSTANLSLSPELQGLVGSNIGNATALSGLEGNLAGAAADRLSTPIDLSNLSNLPQLTGWSAATLDPQWKTNDERAAQAAYNQGLAPGSAGYATAMQTEGTLKNQAYDQSNLSNINTALQAALQQYNQPLNELTALQSGSQVSQPGIGQTQTPQTSVAGTNIAGLIESNYQNQLAQSNATMGGLFGLGGTLGGGLLQGAGSAGGLGALFAGI